MRKSLICRAFFVFMVNKSVAFAILLDHFLAKWDTDDGNTHKQSYYPIHDSG
jgi:hypothetical protein